MLESTRTSARECLELLGRASRESMLDAGNSSGNAELGLLAKARLQLKLLGIIPCASCEIWCWEPN